MQRVQVLRFFPECYCEQKAKWKRDSRSIMAEELHTSNKYWNENPYHGEGLRGPGWVIAGAEIAKIAMPFLGGVLGGGRCGANAEYVTQRDAEKDAEIAELKTDKKFLEANVYTDKKITEAFSVLDAKINGLNQAINAQAVVNANITATLSCQAQQIAGLMSLTDRIIPIEKVCPAPMPQYNSWTAPTAPAGA
jgi:hypothetical protein